MKSLISFVPDLVRAQNCDRSMHAGLASSLAHLSDAVAPADTGMAIALAKFSQQIQAGKRVPPIFFALYYRLAAALMGQRLDVAQGIATRMESLPERSKIRQQLVTGTDAALPLTALLADEGDPLLNFAPVTPADAVAFAGLLDAGFGLMQRHLPELRGEIDTIVHEILLGHAQPGSIMEFDGASHYQYWGLLMLNPKHHKTPLAVVEVLAHECAHSLLFGMTIDEPLVLNPDSETYVSPLRPDPRPMDGIYHATFVSARMAYAMERMADAGSLTPAERATAAAAARTDRANFASGLGVVRAHGRLTETGAAIMDAAEAWISG